MPVLPYILNDTLLYRLMDRKERELQEQAVNERAAMQQMYDASVRMRDEDREYYKRLLDVAREQAKLAKGLGRQPQQYEEPEAQQQAQLGAMEGEWYGKETERRSREALEKEGRKQAFDVGMVGLRGAEQLQGKKDFLDYQLEKGYPWRTGRGPLSKNPKERALQILEQEIDNLRTRAFGGSLEQRFLAKHLGLEAAPGSEDAARRLQIAERLKSGLASGAIRNPEEALRQYGAAYGWSFEIEQPQAPSAPQAPQAPGQSSEEDQVIQEELRRRGIP